MTHSRDTLNLVSYCFVVMRFIKSHIASEADARAILLEITLGHILTCCFVVYSRLLMYHHLLDHGR